MIKDISIYIPVYNGASTIEYALKSIFNQTIEPNEILVIDDCSTDKTFDILKKYEKRITIIRNDTNMGLAFTRNKALNYLKTKYVAAIDADVVLENDWLEVTSSVLTNKRCALVGGKLIEKYTKNKYNFWRSIRLKQNWGNDDVLNPPIVFGCNNLLDRSVFNENCKYDDSNPFYKTNGEDGIFSGKLKKNNYKLYYASKAICHHLQNDDAKSLSNRYWRYMYYGDGMKKRSFFKILKSILRQVRKTIQWSFNDISKNNFTLVLVNFEILLYFSHLEFKKNKKNLF